MLYIIPTHISPLKNTVLASGEDRKNMLEIAFKDEEKAVISDIELYRDGTSYTCDTVAQLRAIHPKDKLYYLIGDDWLAKFCQWRNYEYILDNVRLAVANRSGRDLKAEAKEFFKLTKKRVLLLDNEVKEVSSSELRDNLDKSKLPEGVFEYIEQRGLYKR